MRKIANFFIFLFLFPSVLFALQWRDLWQTPDQQGAKLLQAGKAKEASEFFTDDDWKGVALYQAGLYSDAFQQFNKGKTSDHHYNAGNAAAQLGNYQEAIAAYDKAISLNPNNTDAIINRDIVKKQLEQKKEPKQSEKNNKNDNKNNKDNKKDSKKDDKKNNEQNENETEPPSNQKNELSDPTKSHHQNKGQLIQEEAKNQLLRRLADDPGSLLQQKFLRDYYRRHTAARNQNQGES